MASKLSARQQRFIEEYPVDCNGAQAAIVTNRSKKPREALQPFQR